MERDEAVYAIAKKLYEADRNEFMPPWDEAPSVYARGYLTTADIALKAAEELGMSPPLNTSISISDLGDGANPWSWEAKEILKVVK